MKLNDKVIIITGAGTGLGREVAKKAAQEGGKMILIGRTETELKSVQQEIENNKGLAKYFICDIRNEGEINEIVKNILKEYKDVDILVNNAGIWTDNEIEKNNPDKKKEVFEINVLGNINFTNVLLPYFKEKNAGYIFNVISSAGVTDIEAGANVNWKTYYSSKWALSGYTKALREELMGTKIKLTGFFPGGFDSMLYEKANRPNPHDQPWMMKTEDVADIVIFALTRPEDVLIERLMVSKAT